MDEQDALYMMRAKFNAKHSNCLSHPIGAVLVTESGQVIDGWNGPPCVPGMEPLSCKQYYDGCPRKQAGAGSGERMELCSAVHAERRPLLQAAAWGYCTNNSTLYAWCGLPCKDCMIELIEAGVKRIVCLTDDKFNRKTPTAYNFALSHSLFLRAGLNMESATEEHIRKLAGCDSDGS